MLGQSYKQINFLRSEYVSNRFMNFESFGKNLCIFDKRKIKMLFDNVIIQQTSNKCTDNFWTKLANAYANQIDAIQHAHHIVNDATYCDWSDLKYIPTIGLLVTKLSNIHEQFDNDIIQAELAIAATFETFLITAYNKSWLAFYTQYNIEHLTDLPNTLKTDMFCKFMCAMSDALAMYSHTSKFNEYASVFLRQTMNIMFSFQDNVEFFNTDTEYGTTLHLSHHRNSKKLKITKHNCHALRCYKHHKTTYKYCNERNFTERVLSTLSSTLSSTILTIHNQFSVFDDFDSLIELTLLNLHVKLIDYIDSFDIAKFKLKRLNRQFQIINYKQTHFRHFENVLLCKFIGKSRKHKFVHAYLHDDFIYFEHLFAMDIYPHAYSEFIAEHDTWQKVEKLSFFNDNYDNLSDFAQFKFDDMLHQSYGLVHILRSDITYCVQHQIQIPAKTLKKLHKFEKQFYRHFI